MKCPPHDRKTLRQIAKGVPYQGNRLTAALPFCRSRRLAIDVGAHIGLWSVQLADQFARVVAFEPNLESFDALVENTMNKGVSAFRFALGDQHGFVSMAASGLGAHIDQVGLGDVEGAAVLTTLDTVNLIDVDFIKIDVEGFETFVLRGGEQTIRRDRPVIVLEQKYESRYGLEERAAVRLLQSWGAVVEWRVKNDYCVRWR
jgi:FkbM family methyltransferase